MRLLSCQGIRDDPVLVAYIKDPACMDHLIPVAEVGRMLRVGIASGIDDQRLAEGSDLYIQHVIVSMPAIAERAAIEDEKAFLMERSFALAPTDRKSVV